jgi:hypothetical protein
VTAKGLAVDRIQHVEEAMPVWGAMRSKVADRKAQRSCQA